jgi:hypothetical protein
MRKDLCTWVNAIPYDAYEAANVQRGLKCIWGAELDRPLEDAYENCFALTLIALSNMWDDFRLDTKRIEDIIHLARTTAAIITTSSYFSYEDDIHFERVEYIISRNFKDLLYPRLANSITEAVKRVRIEMNPVDGSDKLEGVAQVLEDMREILKPKQDGIYMDDEETDEYWNEKKENFHTQLSALVPASSDTLGPA